MHHQQVDSVGLYAKMDPYSMADRYRRYYVARYKDPAIHMAT